MATSRHLAYANVAFRYSRRGPLVIDGLTWTPGRREALLGPNGAGKSTLIKLATGALTPVAGEVSRPSNRRPGHLPQMTSAVGGLTSREQVALAGWMQGMSRTAAWDAAAIVLDRVGLSSCRDRRVRELSGGQLRRVGIAEVLVDEPDIALLDEPAAGLDPLQRSQLRDVLRDLDLGQLVISTHQVDDLAHLVETVSVLVSGRVLFQGRVEDFLELGADDPDGLAAECAYRRILAGSAP